MDYYSNTGLENLWWEAQERSFGENYGICFLWFLLMIGIVVSFAEFARNISRNKADMTLVWMVVGFICFAAERRIYVYLGTKTFQIYVGMLPGYAWESLKTHFLG